MRFRFIEDRRADYLVRGPVRRARGLRRRAIMPGGRARRAGDQLPIRDLIGDIQQVHREAYGRYGSPRIHAELRAQGRGASRGRIERLMRRHGIRAIMAKPRRACTTDSRRDFPIAPNLLFRNFTAAAPESDLARRHHQRRDRAGLARSGHGPGPLQPQDRRLGDGRSFARRPAVAALRVAISAQRPGAGLIHHFDRSFQFASTEYPSS